jgi:chemotaxis signal transduction protein
MPKEKKAANRNPDPEVGPIPLALLGAEPVFMKPDVVSVLLFEIGRKPFAIGVEHTEGVVDCPRVSPLPNSPDGMAGIASVRGRMTLVIDLSLMANVNEVKRRLILVKGEAQLGLLAERVEGVIALDSGQLRKAEAGKESVGLRRVERSLWPVRAYFENDGQRVPVIDVELLAEI